MTLQVAYTAGGTTGFVDVPSLDLSAKVDPTVDTLADVKEWARTATIVSNPADECLQAHDREMAFRIETMAQSAGLTLDELQGIHAASGLSWPAIELILATLRVQNWRYTRDV